MPIPRVFVASTCFDLGHFRQALETFIRSLGYDPVLSDQGDVFFDPSKHTHEACLEEVRSCQLFVLLIGGRYGGSFKDTEESITYFEYKTAIDEKIPVFALVSQSVYSDHHTWLTNSKKPDIRYPNVDNIRIFDFIEIVRKQVHNNAIMPFSSFDEIKEYLQKQWAGLVCSLLRSDSRLIALDQLGIVRVHQTATEDNEYFDKRVAPARFIRILAVNAEMLLRNRPEPFKSALSQGSAIEVLLASESSELVAEMERMEIVDGRDPATRSIPECIRQSEPEFRSLLSEVKRKLVPGGTLGTVSIGYFNTQYRETMIICDDSWVWWTPHLNPARGASRPTFVAEGAASRLVGMCVKHFEAVKNMVTMRAITV